MTVHRTRLALLIAALATSSAGGDAGTAPPSTAGDPVWRPPRAPPSEVKWSFRLIDASPSSRSVYEVSGGAFYPQYQLPGKRPREPLAKLSSDWSERSLSGVLWAHMDPDSGVLVDDLRAKSSDQTTARCQLTEAGVLRCRHEDRDVLFWIKPGGTITWHDGAKVTADTSW